MGGCVVPVAVFVRLHRRRWSAWLLNAPQEAGVRAATAWSLPNPRWIVFEHECGVGPVLVWLRVGGQRETSSRLHVLLRFALQGPIS